MGPCPLPRYRAPALRRSCRRPSHSFFRHTRRSLEHAPPFKPQSAPFKCIVLAYAAPRLSSRCQPGAAGCARYCAPETVFSYSRADTLPLLDEMQGDPGSPTTTTTTLAEDRKLGRTTSHAGRNRVCGRSRARGGGGSRISRVQQQFTGGSAPPHWHTGGYVPPLSLPTAGCPSRVSFSPRLPRASGAQGERRQPAAKESVYPVRLLPMATHCAFRCCAISGVRSVCFCPS